MDMIQLNIPLYRVIIIGMSINDLVPLQTLLLIKLNYGLEVSALQHELIH